MPEKQSTDTPQPEKQCRICLDGTEVEVELGRLIRPCLCKGSMSYVHVKCLHRWRNSSISKTAFFSCPQCHYKYHFVRTRVVGIATNPLIIAAITTVIFTIIVLLSSFLTTYFISSLDEPRYSSFFFVSPFDIAQDLIRAAFRIMQDENSILSDPLLSSSFRRKTTGPMATPLPRARPGIIKWLIHRFILGLPIVGASSLVHMLLSMPLIGPVHWLARYRGNRNRRGNSRDIAAILVIVLLVAGAARAIYKVYELTQKMTKRLLTRAEDAILEVN